MVSVCCSAPLFVRNHTGESSDHRPAAKSLCKQQSMAPRAEGRGSVVDEHTVEVELSAGGTKTLTTKYILIATGGKPVKAPIPGSVRPLTAWEFMPSSAASCNSLRRLGMCRQFVCDGGMCSGCSVTCFGALKPETLISLLQPCASKLHCSPVLTWPEHKGTGSTA